MIKFFDRTFVSLLIDHGHPRKTYKRKILINDGIINRGVISVVNRSQLNEPK